MRYDAIARAWMGFAVVLIGIAALVGATIWVLTPAEAAHTDPVALPKSVTSAPSLPHLAHDSGDRLYLTPNASRLAAKDGLLPAGIKSIIDTTGQLKYGQYKWDTVGVPPGKLKIRVDLDRQLISVFIGPHEVGTAIIVYGANGKESPRGHLPILGKTKDYHSITYDAPMPYSLWLRSDGVAIHGSEVTPGHATNGCIGVPTEFAKRLFALAHKGDIVDIIGDAKAG